MIGVMTNTEGQGSDPKGKAVPKSDMVLLDLNPAIPGVDTAYTTGGKADYEKWSLVNGSWTRLSTKQLVNSSEDIRALEAVVDGTTVTLFATTGFGVYRLVDATGYNAGLSASFAGSYFIQAAGTSQFRGIAVVPEPASLLLLGLSGLALWRRRR